MAEQVHKMQENKSNSQDTREKLKQEILNLSEKQLEYVLKKLREEIL